MSQNHQYGGYVFKKYFFLYKNSIKQNTENPVRHDLELCLWIVEKKFNPIRSIHFAQSWQPTWKTCFREKRV